MKKNLLTITFVMIQAFFGLTMAQPLSPKMQTVFDACVQMQTAIGAGNTAVLRTASATLKECKVKDFSSFKPVDENPLSLDGHFVFDYEFADSLIAGREVYKFAQRYADLSTVRGITSTPDQIYTKTYAIKSNSSAKYTFYSTGTQELAVVAEPGGLITLKVHDLTHDTWYNDTKKVKKGQPSRILIFDLPTDKRSKLEVEVINRSKKDISFVVISN